VGRLEQGSERLSVSLVVAVIRPEVVVQCLKRIVVAFWWQFFAGCRTVPELDSSGPVEARRTVQRCVTGAAEGAGAGSEAGVRVGVRVRSGVCVAAAQRERPSA